MPIKLFKFAGIFVQTLNEEKTASLDIVDDSISVHSVHHFMYIDLFATKFNGKDKEIRPTEIFIPVASEAYTAALSTRKF